MPLPMLPNMPRTQLGGQTGRAPTPSIPAGGIGYGGVPYMGYGPLYNPYLMLPAYRTPALSGAVPPAYVPAYQPSASSAMPSESSSPSASLAPERKETAPRAPTPVPEATNRLRFISLNVTGLQNASDSAKLEAALNKMKQVRGVSVKRKDDGQTVVKIWYSDSDPLNADTLVQTTSKLGFAAVVAEAN